MAKLILISGLLAKPNVQEVDDIVAVLPDDHKLSPTEEQIFDTVIDKKTVDEIVQDDDYGIEIIDLLLDGSIVAWKDKKDSKLKQLKNKPAKYHNRYDKDQKKVINKIREKSENNDTEVVIELKPIEGI